MSNEALLALSREKQSTSAASTLSQATTAEIVNLRVKVLSITKESIRVVHCPQTLFKSVESTSEDQVSNTEQDDKDRHKQAPPYGVI